MNYTREKAPTHVMKVDRVASLISWLNTLLTIYVSTQRNGSKNWAYVSNFTRKEGSFVLENSNIYYSACT